VYLSFTLTFPKILHLHCCHVYIHNYIYIAHVSVLGCVSVYILELSIKSSCLWASFPPQNPCFNSMCKARKFIKSGYEMLKFNITWTRFESNYNSCTCKNNENIGINCVGAREKEKTRWNSIYHKNWWFCDFHNPLNVNVFILSFLFFESHIVYDQT
jgi:hypothetical protein